MGADGALRTTTPAAGEGGGTAPPAVGYLCSEYPAVSHTFILREVESLRRLGAPVHTFTIHRADRAQLLSRLDLEADATTFAILPPSWPRLLRAHLGLARRRPGVYARTLLTSLRLAPPGARGLLWQLFYFVEAVLLWDECRRRGVRHLHVHFANVSADVALLVTELGKATEPARRWSWSFTMHGPTEFADVGFFRLAEKARRADFVVCISDFARSQLMALLDPAEWGKLEIVRVGLPVERFTRAGDGAAAGGGPAPDGAVPGILCVGRLVPEKGQAVLLEAFALLRARGVEATLTLVGEGPERGRLEARAAALGLAAAVEFTGAIGQEDTRARYAEASVFCLASFAEGVPVVLMEAMAMRVPVVSTPIAGIGELIADGTSGYLVPPGRVPDLAAALQHLLADPDLRARFGTAGREAVLTHFDAAATGPQLFDIFARELAGSRRA